MKYKHLPQHFVVRISLFCTHTNQQINSVCTALLNTKTFVTLDDFEGSSEIHVRKVGSGTSAGMDSEYVHCILLLLNRPDLQVNIPNKKAVQ
jgi:hypothetical protein